jgi:hypothetical protein
MSSLKKQKYKSNPIAVVFAVIVILFLIGSAVIGGNLGRNSSNKSQPASENTSSQESSSNSISQFSSLSLSAPPPPKIKPPQ